MRKSFNGISPATDGAFVAENATLIGAVTMGRGSSVWYGAVLRGDVQPIYIGERTNIQDLAMIHATTGRTPTTVGNDVTVGHGAILHGCTIGDEVLIGMGAVILDGAIVPGHTLVAAKALVLENSVLESGWLYGGIPAKKIKPLSEEQLAFFARSAAHYVAAAQTHFDACAGADEGSLGILAMGG